MRFEFCPYCGTRAIPKNIGDEGLTPYCNKCGIPLFDMFSTCVLCVAVNEYNEIALIKQGYVSDKYVGIAGYIKPGETAEETAKREIAEEIGIAPTDLSYLKSYWHEKKGLLMLGFTASVSKADFKLSCEVDSARWFSFEAAKEAVRYGSDIYKLICRADEALS